MGPGKFISDLTLRRDGSYVLDYRGEIVLETAEAMARKTWQDGMAHCTERAKTRACSPSEIAEQRRP